MKRSNHSAATLLSMTVALALAASGCKQDPGLEVGFARVPMPWRVGAKPGQVGTEALPDMEQQLTRMLGELLPVLMEEDYDPELLIHEVTDWTLLTLEERLDHLEPGRYSFLSQPGQGIELPPDVKAVVISCGDRKVALVRADIFLMSEHIQTRVAQLIEPATGIGRDGLFLSASHNHSAPHAMSPAAGPWSLVDAFDPRQFAYVTHAIAQAVIEANAALRPAVMRAHRSNYSEVQQNIIGPRWEELTPPSGGQPVEVEVGFPRDHFDDELHVLRFEIAPGPEHDGEAEGDSHLATIFVLGMHPETLPSGHGITSGEWPLHVEHRLERAHGGFFMWLPGSLGDSEPDRGRANPEHVFWRQGFDAMDEMSEMIARGVTKSWREAGELAAQRNPAVSYMARDVPGPSDQLMPYSTYLGGLRLPMVRILNDATTFPLQLVRIGDVLLAGVPAETVSDLSLNIKSRLGAEHEEVYQGHVFESAPDWVRERIAHNFSTTTLPPELRVEMPIVVNMTAGYMGYVVTRWEYENREHYRQSLTTYGPGTAEQLAGALVGMATELLGGRPFSIEAPPWSRADSKGMTDIGALLASFDEKVKEISRDLPVSDPGRVGELLSAPAEDHDADDPLMVTWRGGTNDLPPPTVTIEAELDGEWASVAFGPSGDVWIFYEEPDEWTAWWRTQEVSEPTRVRIRAQGLYRSAVPGSSEPDPLFDPDGANERYDVETAPITLRP